MYESNPLHADGYCGADQLSDFAGASADFLRQEYRYDLIEEQRDKHGSARGLGVTAARGLGVRIQYPGACYHITCRGNERRNIYRGDSDREMFLNKLQESLEIYGVILHAYVLMGNHFHLIVQTPRANLSEFMRHFNIAYLGTYNEPGQRTPRS